MAVVEALDSDSGDAVAVVALTGELDVADPEWAEDLDAMVAGGTNRLVLDLTNVTFIDSSVVRALVLTHRRVGADGWVRLVYTHHLIARVIQICGLADTFPQHATVESALRSTPTRDSVRSRRIREMSMNSEGPAGDRDDAE